MPADIRREVCRRLSDNETAQSIIDWLDKQPAARQILDDQFDGAKVLPQNISEWKRNPEFARFLAQRDSIANTKALAEFSVDLARSAGGIGAGAVALLGGKIMQALESADAAAVDDLTCTVAKLRQREQKDVDLDIKKRVLDQNERKLALAEKQFQLRACELFASRYEDQKIKDIMDGKESKSVKIDQLRLALFGEKPEGLDYGS